MRFSSRRLVLALIAAVVLTPVTARAAGPVLLVDAASEEVLYADDPDLPWYPASLTKMMTAYVVFDAVKAGRIGWDGRVQLSEKARAQPATRIGLRLGIELNVEQAVRALILRSANDFAMALAETVSGSEEAFAAEMNAVAKKLGMSRSRFANPHGLPDPEQVTTARDMARLAIALARDFPDRADVFSGPTVLIHRQTFHSQNDLLRALPGADGMKTGFTCGAGYNVVASAARGPVRLVAVVLGEPTRVARSAKAGALLEHGFQIRAWKQMFAPPRLSTMPMLPADPQAVIDVSRHQRMRKCPAPGRHPVAAAAVTVAGEAGAAPPASPQPAPPPAATTDRARR